MGTEKKEVLVSIRDLEIKFDEYVAVSNVNFDIYKGETFRLLGNPVQEKRPLVGL